MLGRSFVLFFCIPIFVGFATIMGMNIYVDPLALFGAPHPGDTFPEKNFQSIPEHMTLPIVIRNANEIGTLIVGSSTARYVLENPSNRIRNSETAKLLFSNGPVFNAALGGGTVHMALDVIQHAAAFHDVKEVVYVLNFDGLSAKRNVSENYHAKHYDGLKGGRAYARILPILWSTETTQDSIKTLISRYLPSAAEADVKGKGAVSARTRWLRNTGDYLYAGLYSDFDMTTAEIQAIKDIVALAKSRGIKLSIMASPIHPIQMEMIFEAGIFNEYAQHLRIISELSRDADFPFVAFKSYTPPFSSDYFNVGVEGMPVDVPYYQDGVHFNTAIGTDLLRFMKGSGGLYGDDFGVHLNPGNVEIYISSIMDGRDKYLLNNKYVKPLVDDIKLYNPRLN